MVRQATDTAVSASISTPVGPVTLTVARTRRAGAASSGATSTSTLVIASGWQSGMSSLVFFAAMMPAIRAAPSTSPFLALPDITSASVSALMRTRPSATAMRSVAAFSDTSTMRAAPPGSMWVSFAMARSARRPRRRGFPLDQGAGRCGDIRLAHQALADEEGRDADFRQPGEIGRREDAAFADHDAVIRDLRRQPLGDFERGDEGFEIAVVDADERRFEPQRALELGVVMDLEQHVHAMGEGRRLDLGGSAVVERRHDDEDAVGAHRPRLRDLVGLVHEVLAQHRQ